MMMDHEELVKLLERLKEEHTLLDERVTRLASESVVDHIELQRLKKHKLRLKDRITKIEMELFPDIIA
ncbi:MAG: YdcH family protein [Alphaproteobacteria bacterium]